MSHMSLSGMILLFCLALLLIPSVQSTKDPPQGDGITPFRTLDHITNWWKHLKYCSTWSSSRDSDDRPLWLVTIKNSASGGVYPGALISPIHVITLKEAVTVLDEGKEEVIPSHNIRVYLFQSIAPIEVKHSVVPLDAQRWMDGILDDLAIVQLSERAFPEGKIPDSLALLCQRDTVTPTKEMYKVYFDSNTDNEKGGERDYPESWMRDHGPTPLAFTSPSYHESLLSLTRPTGKSGSIWVERQWGKMKTDRFIGIGINETSALLLSDWEPFVCRHTGVCMSDKSRHESSRLSSSHRPFVLDGALMVEECTVSWKSRALQEATLLTRLTRNEAKHVMKTCGDEKAGLVKFQVIIESGNERCFGVIISPLHVATTAECLKKLGNSNDKERIRVYYAVGEKDKEVYKDAVAVKRVAIPYDKFDRNKITYNMAVLEVESRMEDATMACLPPYDRLPRTHDILYNVPTLDNAVVSAMASNEFYIPDHVNGLWKYTLYRRCAFYRICDVLYYDKLTMERLRERARKDPVAWETRLRLVKELGRPGTGSPLTELVDGRRVVNALACNWDTQVEDLKDLTNRNAEEDRSRYIGIYVREFKTFICIHTGLCEEQFDYEGQHFLPFNIEDTTAPRIMNRIRQRKLRMKSVYPEIQAPTYWQAAKDEMDQWLNGILLHDISPQPNVLSKEENAKMKEICGKTRVIYEDWPVLIVPRYMDDIVMCGGVMISPRHVITSASCVKSFHPVHYSVFVRHYFLMVQLKNKIDVANIIFADSRDTPSDLAVDVAILELSKPIPSDRYNQILCVPDPGYEWKPEMYWYGKVHGKIRALSFWPYRTPFETFAWRNGQEIFALKVWKNLSPDGLEFTGTPFVRERTNDPEKRLYLYGVGTKIQNEAAPIYSKTEHFISLICRMSGVCPMEKEDEIVNLDDENSLSNIKQMNNEDAQAKKNDMNGDDDMFKEKQIYLFDGEKLCRR